MNEIMRSKSNASYVPTTLCKIEAVASRFVKQDKTSKEAKTVAHSSVDERRVKQARPGASNRRMCDGRKQLDGRRSLQHLTSFIL